MSRRLRGAGLSAVACALFAVGAAQAQRPKAAVLTDSSDILKRYPDITGSMEHGARVKLNNGSWVEITDNPFSPTAPPSLCWYAPSLHTAGFCLTAPGVNVMVLVDLHTGHRVTAPGYPRLMPEPNLIAVGPDAARKIESDSVTLVRVASDDLVDEGGALFDDTYGPGGWMDGDCYKLKALGGGAGGWLERTPGRGWNQVDAAQSTVCQGRHAR